MSATVAALPDRRSARFFHSTIGKKAVMAISGIALFGFVVGHLVGNLQVFQGPAKLNSYAAFLHDHGALLWSARIGLLVMVAAHIWSSIQLANIKIKARPVRYTHKQNVCSTYASRTMYWSGPIIAVFVVYHLMHMTWGIAHPDFQRGDVYANVIAGFRVIPVSLFYIFAMMLLGLHLYHGLWSMFQTLGVNHPRYTPLLKSFAAVATALIIGGNISIPIAIMSGLVN